MLKMDMALKDLLFLKETIGTLEKYITCITYQDQNVRIEIPDQFVNDFLLDWRSAYVRLGKGEHGSLNKTGVAMDRIYQESILPALHK